MIAKTISAEQVWQSPDKEKTIWNVSLEADGKQYAMKTFSPSVAVVGWQGEVESYANQRGERFVKPVGQDDGTKAGADCTTDERIRSQWAIGQAAQAVMFTVQDEQYEAAVLDLAIKFYTMVPNVIEGAK
jgi:hypothetical protein